MKTYTVVGQSPVVIDGRDVCPGETVTADIAPEQEAFFLTIGALAVVDEPAVAPEPIPAPAPPPTVRRKSSRPAEQE
jgi:hypothetical protein